MIKTIMVSLRGQATDEAALETAYLIARLFAAHIEAVHVSPSWAAFAASMAAQSLESAISPVEAIESFEAEARNAAARAKAAFEALCARRKIPQSETPLTPERLTASWREVTGSPARLIAAEARFHDLAVVARSPDHDADWLLIDGGRPVVMAPENCPENLAPTIAIAWKDTPEAARAVMAAMPLLERAGQAILIGADEGSGPDAVIDSTARVAEALSWHGVKAETHCVNPSGRSVAEAIVQCALGSKADLLVMGAYGHSRLRELILGGVTRDVLRHCALPVFLFH